MYTIFLQNSNVDITQVFVFLFPILYIVIGVLIFASVVRWVFKIDRQLENQRATIWLLIFLCEKNGVGQEKIETLKKILKVK